MKKRLLQTPLFSIALGLAALGAAPAAHAQWTPVGTTGFAANGNTWTHLFMDANNTPYVSFASQGKVMKYDGTSWTALGGAISSTNTSDCWSAISPNGNVYYSFIEGGGSVRAAVSVFNGTSWVSLGTGISADTASYTNIAVSSAGVPYLSYIQKGTPASSVFVKKYNGTSWSAVGGALTTTGASYACMTIGANDTPFVAYQDAAASQNITVQKFDGTNWLPVGTPFCAQPFGGAFFISMAMDNNGVPYVAYMNPYPMGPKVCVQKFAGGTWVNVGNPSFTGTGAIFTSIAIDKNNVPYVSFQDGANSSKVGVMKYDGTSWVVVGSTPNVSSGAGIFTSMAIDANNNPFVAYMENAGGTTVMEFPVCTAASAAVVSASDTTICKGTTVALHATGTLNSGTNWYWYSGSCTGSLVDSGITINRAPEDTTTYYVHGRGGCILYSPCTSLTINVDSAAKPVIAAVGTSLTATAATGYQWYKAGSIIAGATTQTYTATASGWYKVVTFNAANCNATSDSVYIVPTGIASANAASGIRIYPTCFRDQVELNIDNALLQTGNVKLVIRDNTGRVVLEQAKLSGNNHILLSALIPGLYFANVISPEYSYSVKLVKQ